MQTERIAILRGHREVVVCLVIPPTRDNQPEHGEYPKPGLSITPSSRRDFLLKKIFVIPVVLSRFNDVLERFCTHDDSRPSSGGVCRFDDEGSTQPLKVAQLQLDFLALVVRRNNNSKGDVDPFREKLEVHRRFVVGLDNRFGGIDEVCRRLPDCTGKMSEFFIRVIRSVKKRPKNKLPSLDLTGCFLGVVMGY